jgi:hypothetical protein
VTKELALQHVLLVPGTTEGEHAWLALEQGGCKKVSDLKEIIFEDLEKLVHAMGTAAPTATCHPNTLQRRKMSLIPLSCQDQDVHEPPTCFNLTPEMFDAWRGEKRAKTFESTQASLDTAKKTSVIGCFIK